MKRQNSSSRQNVSYENTWFQATRKIHEIASESLPKPNYKQSPERVGAIFIMFKGEYQKLRGILSDISELGCPIFCLGSSSEDRDVLISWNPDENVSYLDVYDSQVYQLLINMKTNQHKYSVREESSWDLDIKRNTAIWYATTHGHNKILLLDVDVRMPWNSLIPHGSETLERFAVASLVFNDFPDLSCVEHAANLCGYNIKPFLGGGCMFVRLPTTLCFFPPVYNEDWMFMLDQSLGGGVAGLGSAQQIPHAPFDDVDLPKFQEFGEVLVEGFVWLTLRGRYTLQFELSFWDRIIELRLRNLEVIFNKLKQQGSSNASAAQNCILSAIERLKAIDGAGCTEFVRSFRHDQFVWKKILENH